jgi:uridine kinase
MLARRLRRDVVERGRDPEGILDQYLRFVKPSYDSFVLPTAKHADVIIPGLNNENSLELIVSHIRRQLEERKQHLRSELYKEVAASSEGEGDSRPSNESSGTVLPRSVVVLEQTVQVKVRLAFGNRR